MTIRTKSEVLSKHNPHYRARLRRDKLVAGALFAIALSAIAITIAIAVILLRESFVFFEQVSIVDFLTDTMWTPLFYEPRYGIMPLLSGTLLSSAVAIAFALPIGLIVAVYLSEFAPIRVRETVKPILELLVSVPTVVFGYFALFFVTPLLQQTLFPNLPSFNVLSAGIVIGVMIIPYISSLSEDAMRAVPMALREGSLALGANRVQTALKVVFPAAASGIIAAIILAVSRAVGETMVVAIAAGQQPNLTIDPTEQAATITAYIVQVAMGDLPHGSIGYQSIFAAGLTLFVITMAFNILAAIMRRKFREEY
ncbi:MAG: phosphate ABC transporter permease subunit PstC [Alphaproteobacteria bacterium]|nr:phosphate ABC transporter permease subunit PstC [Alphaproteobacteria bacterium]